MNGRDPIVLREERNKYFFSLVRFLHVASIIGYMTLWFSKNVCLLVNLNRLSFVPSSVQVEVELISE